MIKAADLTYDQIEIGMMRSFRRSITNEEIDLFGRLSGDLSPLHTDNNYAAAQTQYRERLVHGMHLASLVSCLVGMHLPGFRSVCLSQQFDFLKPVYAGQEIEVIGEVQSKQEINRTIVLRTRIVLLPDILCVKGKAVVQVLDTRTPAP